MGLSVVRFELEGAPTWGVISNNKIHRITQSFAHQRDLLKTYFDAPKAFANLIEEKPLEQNVSFLSPLLESTPTLRPRAKLRKPSRGVRHRRRSRRKPDF